MATNTRSEVWFQVGVRLPDKFEVMHIADKLDITVNECIGALIRLWSISITDFPESNGSLTNGSLSVGIEHLPKIMQLENEPQDIFDALEECSWIEQVDGIIVIPQWEKKTGQTILKLARDRKYKSKEEG